MGIVVVFIILLVLAGTFTAFLIAIFSYLSQHKLNELLKTDDKLAVYLNELRNKYEESLNSMFVFEFTLYSLASFLAGSKFYYEDNHGYSLLSILVLLAIILSLRVLLYSIGVRYADDFALRFAGLTKIIIRLVSPLIYIRVKLTDLFGGDQNTDDSREEISAMVETAMVEGSLDEDEYRILTGIMKYSNVLVSDVMTPRTVVFSCNSEKNIEQVSSIPELEEYSRFPVWKGENIDDEIIGYVLSRDVYINKIKNKGELALSEITKEVFRITENSKLDIALETFLEKKQHICIVLDEYGGFTGILTMEDVLETIIGAEIVDEADKTVDLRELAKRRRDKRLHSRKINK